MAVNIQIGNTVFHCPVGKLAGETVDVIRTSRRLIGGELERNGIVMFAGDKIVADGNYSFIHFEHVIHPAEYLLPPFHPQDMQNEAFRNGGFIGAPLPSPIPVGTALSYPEIPPQDVDRSRYDDYLSTNLNMFMLTNPLPAAVGEHGAITRNSTLVLNPLMKLCRMDPQRNRSTNSTVGSARPDLSLLKDGIPLLIGEEKVNGHNTLQRAFQDLQRKCIWISCYNSMPFVPVIAFGLTDLAIYEFRRDEPRFHRIFYSDTLTKLNRWGCIKAIINVGRAINYFHDNHLYTKSEFAFNRWHHRDEKSIKITAAHVTVHYIFQNLFIRMIDFYTATKQIRHLETCIGIDQNKQWIVLSPVGANRLPRNTRELATAIIHISSAVIQLHDLDFLHCDIRWSNVVIDIHRDWYLIDCTMFCSTLETALRQDRINELNERFVLNTQPVQLLRWTKRHDFFQIGMLITIWEEETGNVVPEVLANMCESLTNTASDRVVTKVQVNAFLDQLQDWLHEQENQ